MKTIYLCLSLFLLFLASSCSNNTTPVGPGSTVTFQIQGQGDPNSYTFGFKPNVNITLSNIIVSLPAQGFFDTLVNNNPGYIFSSDTVYTLDPYVGVNQGQTWTFAFAGTIASNNTAYSTSVNFVVP